VPEIESVASIRARAEKKLTKHQRAIESVTGALGKPRTLAIIVLCVVGWIAFNLIFDAKKGHLPIDPPPFVWLQIVVTVSSLFMTTLVLITGNRLTLNAEHRSHLDLQINLLAEQKITKLVSLIEELRRDLPMVRKRIDPVADAMQEAVNPDSLLAALERTSLPPTTNTEPTTVEPATKNAG
jgi:uncharacterized membrane protein